MSEILEMARQHCAQVATLHLTHLASPFGGRPGQELLMRYYDAVCDGRGAVGFVAASQDRVVGYICGVWDPVVVRRRVLRESLPGLMGWAALQVLQRPALLLDLWKRFAASSASQEISPGAGQQTGGYELRPIVVAPNARGSGVAAKLVQALQKDASARGFSQIYLFTEMDNSIARRFYSRLGFVQTGEGLRSGVLYLRYELPIPGAN